MHLRVAARFRSAVHRPLGGIPLRGGVRHLREPGMGGGPRSRFSQDGRGGIRARLERHLPAVRGPARTRPGRCGTLSMGAIRRLPEALQEDPGAPLSRDIRDPGAGRRSAADHPEYSRRGDRSPERRPAASADCRADHLQPVLATDVDYSRVSRELHGPQHGLRDDVAVFPPYTVAAVLVLRQTQDRRYLRALPGEPHDPRVPHGIDRDDGAQSADGLHLLHNHVPLQREDDAPVDRFRHSDHGAHRDRHAEDQELCTRGFLRVDRSEVFPDGSAGGVETIKGMGIERTVRLKWEKKYAKSLEVQYRAQAFNIAVSLGSQMLNAATTIAILWVGANMVLTHEMTIGQLIAFNAFMGSVLTPLMGLIGLWSLLNDAGVAMERLGDVLDMEPEQKPEDLPSRIMLPDLQGEISLNNVYFRYGGADTEYVLENISFEIKPGELIAIVGRSGSGKTTLAKLLVGFYTPTEGKMVVDGYDLNVIDKTVYRAQIGYVMQSNLLFSGTIAENVASGDEAPDRRRIEEAAKMADAHAFISKMPLGYEQIVGERGVGLSGGQIQRLCIARALYHDPRLLVFDEATSALDTQSESNILGNMQEILKGRTAVIIAHRLSTIMRADKILVLYEGAIVEQGRHDELVARKGMYYQLVQKQLSAA